MIFNVELVHEISFNVLIYDNRWLSIAHKSRSIDILETEFLKFLNQQKMMPMITDETTVLYLKKHVKINSKEKDS